MTFKTACFASALAVAALGLNARAEEAPKSDYPLDVCVITNQPLDSMGGEVSMTHEGTEVKFCCRGCIGAFRRNPEPHLARIRAAAEAKAEEEGKTESPEHNPRRRRAAAHAARVTPYPLEVCVVSGEGLKDHGEPVVFVHEGRQIKLCCNGCKTEFDEDPAKFLKRLETGEVPAPPADGHHHHGHAHPAPEANAPAHGHREAPARRHRHHH